MSNKNQGNSKIFFFEKKISKYFLAFSKQYADALSKKRHQTNEYPRITLDKEWADKIYEKYVNYKSKYKGCFDPESYTDVKLDEHKVIAILMASILEVGINKEQIQGNSSILIVARFTVYVMIRFLEVYYQELRIGNQEYSKIEKINFPKSMNGDKYHLQLIKALHYSQQKDEDFNILFLSNIVFFIDNFNHTHYDIIIK